MKQGAEPHKNQTLLCVYMPWTPCQVQVPVQVPGPQVTASFFEPVPTNGMHDFTPAASETRPPPQTLPKFSVLQGVCTVSAKAGSEPQRTLDRRSIASVLRTLCMYT